MNQIFKVLHQSHPVTVNKQDGTQTNKCQIILQEIGGRQANSYVCTLLGNAALCIFSPGDLVLASLRFQHSEYQNKFYNDIIVQDIISFTSH